MMSDDATSSVDYAELLIIDDVLPSDFSPFRLVEYQHYLSFFDAKLLSLEGWHGWISNDGFHEQLARLPIDAKLKTRIAPFKSDANTSARLAYVTFLGNASRLLPYFEERRLPFILQLYPGGGFELDQPATDEKLRRVLLSDLCRKVIVTQTITERYITEKIGCDASKIEMIFGGVFESRIDFEFARDKKFFGRDKPTIDLCFVAHKYSNDLTAKGYDSFVEIASRLYGRFDELRFHVVGDFSRDDIPLGPVDERFTFYGRQPSAFFDDFYPRMDAIVSMNRPFKAAPGVFDGFPTGACIEAGFRGVLNCINDPLELNPVFTSGEDILLLSDDLDGAAQSIGRLLEEPANLYDIARRNCLKFHRVFGTDAQLWARSRLIVTELTRHVGLVIAPAAQRSLLDAAENANARLHIGMKALEQRQREIERAQSLIHEKSKRLDQFLDFLDREDRF